MNLIDVAANLGTEELALEFLERKRWPNGVECVKCYGKKVSKFTTKEGTRKRKNPKTGEIEIKPVPTRHLYQCLNPECKHQFSATTGTVFQDSHISLTKWFLGISLMMNAKKGISGRQLQRDLGVKSYETAWYLAHRIREAMIGSAPAVFRGTVEMDATYVGGKYTKRIKRERWQKQAVMGVAQRKTDKKPSQVEAMPVEAENWSVVRNVVKNRISAKATVYTDEHKAYSKLGDTHRHAIVIHSRKEYVRGDVHNNTIENFWSLFKRGLIGSFHQVSAKHLARYLAEFTYRFNNREEQDLFGLIVINLLAGIPVEYIKLIATPEPSDEYRKLPSSDEPF